MSRHLIRWVIGWIKVGEGIAMVLSLGLYAPTWEYAFIRWHLFKQQQKRGSQ
jgi:hypothetical protein